MLSLGIRDDHPARFCESGSAFSVRGARRQPPAQDVDQCGDMH